MRRALAPLAAAVAGRVEFVCLEAPPLPAGGRGWWRTRVAADGTGGERPRYAGWSASCGRIARAMRDAGPCDGILGFSQGAAMAGLLVGLRAPSGGAPDRPGDPFPAAATPPDFAFSIHCGGFVSRDPDHAPIYGRADRYALPSLHVIGRSDGVVPAALSHRLAGRFADPVVCEHGGGHALPRTPATLAAMAAFLDARMGS